MAPFGVTYPPIQNLRCVNIGLRLKCEPPFPGIFFFLINTLPNWKIVLYGPRYPPIRTAEKTDNWNMVTNPPFLHWRIYRTLSYRTCCTNTCCVSINILCMMFGSNFNSSICKSLVPWSSMEQKLCIQNIYIDNVMVAPTFVERVLGPVFHFAWIKECWSSILCVNKLELYVTRVVTCMKDIGSLCWTALWSWGITVRTLLLYAQYQGVVGSVTVCTV